MMPIMNGVRIGPSQCRSAAIATTAPTTQRYCARRRLRTRSMAVGCGGAMAGGGSVGTISGKLVTKKSLTLTCQSQRLNGSDSIIVMTKTQPTLSYREAGVDMDAGDRLVEAIKPFAKRTMRPEVIAGIGGFGALVELPKRYREPVLVSGTDGVGTKLKLAFALERHDTIGIDLVAMSVNDILVQGAEPLFFLDYYVCEKLDVDVATRVIKGIARGCEIAGCALIGGETAEHPRAFPPGEYDLAGFAVGVVEKSKAIDGTTIVAGDVLIGLASSGPHSNGFSLIRRIVESSGADLNGPADGVA